MLLCAVREVDIVVDIFEFADELTALRVEIDLGVLSGTDVETVTPFVIGPAVLQIPAETGDGFIKIKLSHCPFPFAYAPIGAVRHRMECGS